MTGWDVCGDVTCARMAVACMVAENTIEEKVLALQERKAALFNALTDWDQAFNGTLTADDVRELLAGEG